MARLYSFLSNSFLLKPCRSLPFMTQATEDKTRLSSECLPTFIMGNLSVEDSFKFKLISGGTPFAPAVFEKWFTPLVRKSCTQMNESMCRSLAFTSNLGLDLAWLFDLLERPFFYQWFTARGLCFFFVSLVLIICAQFDSLDVYPLAAFSTTGTRLRGIVQGLPCYLSS